MSQPAMQLVSADLAHASAAQSHESVSELTREAQRLAELAGQFALFGLNVCLSDDAFESADQAYRAEPSTQPAAANDTAGERAFPKLAKRGLHLSPTMPLRLFQAVDWIVVATAAEFAARWGAGVGLADLPIASASAFVFSALAVKAGLWATEFYRMSPAKMRAERGLGGLALGAILGLLAANFFAPDARAAAALAATLPIAAMLLAGIHAALAIWTRAAYRAGAFAETIVLVGATDAAARLAKRGAQSGETRIVAVVDDRVSRAPLVVEGARVGGDIDALLAWEGLPHVDRIVITVTQKAETRVRDIIAKLRSAPNRVDLLLDYDAHAVRGRGVDRLTGAATACVSGRPRNHARTLLKRAQDIAFGALLLAAFALPMLAIAIAVKADSKGPVLYRQRRHGFNNRIITVLKFRSMAHDPEAPLKQVVANDPRITRVGRHLRRMSLDELPQLINVLRGDMSLVGPRPHAVGMKAADRELTHIVAEYAHRHRVKPGITGWAQINGSRGPVDSPQSLRRRVKLDLEYVERASFWFDMQILLRTAPALLGDAKVTR